MAGVDHRAEALLRISDDASGVTSDAKSVALVHALLYVGECIERQTLGIPRTEPQKQPGLFGIFADAVRDEMKKGFQFERGQKIRVELIDMNIKGEYEIVHIGDDGELLLRGRADPVMR